MAVDTNNHNNSATPATSIADLITEFHKTTGEVPPLLIGSTTTLVGEYIYLFGGRLQSTRQISNRLYVLSLITKEWKSVNPQNNAPLPRYFHSANHDGKHHILFYGGMGVQHINSSPIEELLALNDLFFLNIQTMSWEHTSISKDQPTHRYAHISSFVKDRLIIMGGQDVANEYLNDIHIFDFKKKMWCTPALSSQQYQYGAYRSAAFAVTPIQLTPPFVPTMDLLSEPFEDTTNGFQETEITIHTYTNFSTTDVTRQLHSWKINNRNEFVEMQDQSDNIIIGNTSPPPLRFPSAFMCGQRFILAGPHLSTNNQQFQIWALDMTSFVWTKIEAGHVLAQGAWLRGLLCENNNRFLIFGHPDRSMQDDYKDRVHCFEHLACVNIEVFGIYRPPKPSYSAFGQGLGLSLLKDPELSDLKVVTTDGLHIPVNSALIAQRWPSIRQILNPILSPQPTNNTTGLVIAANLADSELLDIDKRVLSFPDTYVVLIAFLQFIYTDHLVTAQQHQPHILARLLFIADIFDIPRLKELATHALHQMLNIQTASMIYEAAIISNAVSLQIRALRVLLNAKKLIQRQKQMDQHVGGERPFSPSLITNNSISRQRGDPHPSRFLQKYEQEPGFPSIKLIPASRSNTPSFPFSPIIQSRSSSQKSHSSESSPTATPGKSSTMKLPNFRIRQTTTSNNSDSEHSTLSSTTLSPKLTPTNSSSTSVNSSNSSRPHTSFWRNNSTVTTMPTSASISFTLASSASKRKNSSLPIDSKPSKSEGTARIATFNFLNHHN